MPALKFGPRVVVSVTATESGDWQVVSTPTSFQGITSALFSENDYIPGFVSFENGEDWEAYDGDSSDNFLEISSISGTVTLTRPSDANIYQSSNNNNRVSAGSGTHTLTLTPSADFFARVWRHINPTWKTLTSGDATPSMADHQMFKTNGTTTITAFDDVETGQDFVLYRNGSDITIQNGASLVLPGGVDLTLTEQEPVAWFKEDGGVIRCVGTALTKGALATVPNVLASSELTIASAAITPSRAHHTVDTEGDAAADDLETITVSAFNPGDHLTIKAENASRVVTIKNGTDNITTNTGRDIALDSLSKSVCVEVAANGTDVYAWLVGSAGGSGFERNDYYSVMDYGATGDGSTDDTSAIQSAIDACEAAGGGVVWFPSPATAYLVTGTLVIDNDMVTLRGEKGGPEANLSAIIGDGGSNATEQSDYRALCGVRLLADTGSTWSTTISETMQFSIQDDGATGTKYGQIDATGAGFSDTFSEGDSVYIDATVSGNVLDGHFYVLTATADQMTVMNPQVRVSDWSSLTSSPSTGVAATVRSWADPIIRFTSTAASTVAESRWLLGGGIRDIVLDCDEVANGLEVLGHRGATYKDSIAMLALDYGFSFGVKDDNDNQPWTHNIVDNCHALLSSYTGSGIKPYAGAIFWGDMRLSSNGDAKDVRSNANQSEIKFFTAQLNTDASYAIALEDCDDLEISFRSRVLLCPPDAVARSRITADRTNCYGPRHNVLHGQGDVIDLDPADTTTQPNQSNQIYLSMGNNVSWQSGSRSLNGWHLSMVTQAGVPQAEAPASFGLYNTGTTYSKSTAQSLTSGSAAAVTWASAATRAGIEFPSDVISLPGSEIIVPNGVHTLQMNYGLEVAAAQTGFAPVVAYLEKSTDGGSNWQTLRGVGSVNNVSRPPDNMYIPLFSLSSGVFPYILGQDGGFGLQFTPSDDSDVMVKIDGEEMEIDGADISISGAVLNFAAPPVVYLDTTAGSGTGPYTLSEEMPDPTAAIVYFDNTLLTYAASSPGTGEFTISGTSLTLGDTPAGSEELVVAAPCHVEVFRKRDAENLILTGEGVEIAVNPADRLRLVCQQDSGRALNIINSTNTFLTTRFL